VVIGGIGAMLIALGWILFGLGQTVTAGSRTG
jgi:hypothetical protein